MAFGSRSREALLLKAEKPATVRHIVLIMAEPINALPNPNGPRGPEVEFHIGGRPLSDLSPDELLGALEERLRVNVGLVAENAKLRRILDGNYE